MENSPKHFTTTAVENRDANQLATFRRRWCFESTLNKIEARVLPHILDTYFMIPDLQLLTDNYISVVNVIKTCSMKERNAHKIGRLRGRMLDCSNITIKTKEKEDLYIHYLTPLLLNDSETRRHSTTALHIHYEHRMEPVCQQQSSSLRSWQLRSLLQADEGSLATSFCLIIHRSIMFVKSVTLVCTFDRVCMYKVKV